MLTAAGTATTRISMSLCHVQGCGVACPWAKLLCIHKFVTRHADADSLCEEL